MKLRTDWGAVREIMSGVVGFMVVASIVGAPFWFSLMVSVFAVAVVTAMCRKDLFKIERK